MPKTTELHCWLNINDKLRRELNTINWYIKPAQDLSQDPGYFVWIDELIPTPYHRIWAETAEADLDKWIAKVNDQLKNKVYY